MTNKLNLKQITKIFPFPKGSLQVLNNINLQIPTGQFISLLGPSGCGKSTLFNIISGIMPPSSGTIYLDNKDITSQTGHCGYMFQDHLLLPWKTVLDNITLGFEIKGQTHSEAKQQAEALLKEFNLYQYAHLHPDTLSGGMKQRIALLRTIAFNSSFLLLDEPFGSLDAITRTTLHHYLIDLWQKFQSTILFTTHDIREALFLSDRVYVLSKKPTKIIGYIEINLPRPRTAVDLTTPEASKLEAQLIQLLKQATVYE